MKLTSLAVNDITKSLQLSQAVSGDQAQSGRSSITPFEKILEKETDAIQTRSASGASSKSKSAKTASLKSIFERASEKYDVSYDFLVAVAKAESDFDPNCVSSAGAQGIMQLMPENCKELGVEDPFDAEENIMAAAKLLKAHLKEFDGDYTLAAAAYNAGSGRVKQYGGVPPYTETQNYVKKIKKYMSEGVTVPDRDVKVSNSDEYADEYSGSGGSTGVEKSGAADADKAESFDTGVAATESDLKEVTVSVGTGDNMVTMTYGAYLKYLELGTTGVG